MPAAASLRDVLAAARPLLQSATGGAVDFSFAGSNAVLEQARRAPVDVVLVASAELLERAARDGVIDGGTVTRFATNSLVVVAHRRRPESWRRVEIQEPARLAELPFRYLALADPQAVPAGIYARRFLETAGLWLRLQDRLAPTADVRAALALAAEAPDVVAVVYASDAPSRDEVEVIYQVPHGLAPEVVYAAAVGARSRYPERAMRLIDALSSPAFSELLEQHGFRSSADPDSRDPAP